MKELTSRQQQAIATKMRIAEKAMELFKVSGFEGVKIQEICQAAEVSVGAFYHYFESKENIIENAYIEVDKIVAERVDEMHYDSAYEKILKIFEEASLFVEHLGHVFMADLYRFMLASPSKYTLSRERYPYIVLRQIFEKGVENGEFINADSIRFTDMCMRIGRGEVLDWCLNEGSYPLAEEAVKAAIFYINSYRVIGDRQDEIIY